MVMSHGIPIALRLKMVEVTDVPSSYSSATIYEGTRSGSKQTSLTSCPRSNTLRIVTPATFPSSSTFDGGRALKCETGSAIILVHLAKIFGAGLIFLFGLEKLNG